MNTCATSHIHPPMSGSFQLHVVLKFQMLLDVGSTDKHIKVKTISVCLCSLCHLLAFVDTEEKFPMDIAIILI